MSSLGPWSLGFTWDERLGLEACRLRTDGAIYIYTHMLVYTHIYIEICTDIDRDSHRAINKKTDIHTGIAIIFDIATETDIDIGTGTDIDIDIYIYIYLFV